MSKNKYFVYGMICPKNEKNGKMNIIKFGNSFDTANECKKFQNQIMEAVQNMDARFSAYYVKATWIVCGNSRSNYKFNSNCCIKKEDFNIEDTNFADNKLAIQAISNYLDSMRKYAEMQNNINEYCEAIERVRTSMENYKEHARRDKYGQV